MNDDFTSAMSNRTDDELIKIVTVHREDYQPAAVRAAEVEMQKRGIDTSRVESGRTTLTAEMEAQDALDASRASTGARFVNYIVDTVAYFILAFLLNIMTNLLMPVDEQWSMLVFYLMLLIALLGYYIFLENKYQKTLGKFITKTTVVRKDGQRAGRGDIVRRTLFRIVPLDNVSYLFTKNGFHDYLSNTMVVRDM